MSSNRKVKLTIPLENAFPDGSFIKTSEKAVGFNVNKQTIWLPKSQIDDDAYADGKFSCWCPTWLVEAKSLEIFVDTSHEPSLFGE